MTKQQYENKTMKSPSAICGKYGHWKKEHLEDGSPPSGVKSVDKPKFVSCNSDYRGHHNNNTQNKKTLSFSNHYMA